MTNGRKSKLPKACRRLSRCSAQTKVLLLGILPRGSRDQRRNLTTGLTEAVMNPQWDKIDRDNGIIETFADGTNVVYLNINQAFLNENGALPCDFMPDLLHPNEKGYEIWANAIRPTLEKLPPRTQNKSVSTLWKKVAFAFHQKQGENIYTMTESMITNYIQIRAPFSVNPIREIFKA